MKSKDQNKLTKWLNKLQQESWQLELVISGFSIFLMLGALDWLTSKRRDVTIASQGLEQGSELLMIAYLFLIGACFFILVNLVLHVLLRGVWISTIGLRYVSGDIDFDQLRLAPKFDKLLRRKIGSFDQYILKLENICSVLFAFTFLIVFMLLAFVMYLIFLIAFVNLFLKGLLGGWHESTQTQITVSFIIIALFAGTLYFIDFLTLGFLKRIKWLSYIYMPFYRFMSFITLSFLYRPIYYNLIDNKFGRRVGFMMIPYVLIIGLLLSEDIQSHIWYPDRAGQWGLMNIHYDDHRPEKSLIRTGSLPSKFVKNGFLELFIAYMPKQDNPSLEKLCPHFEPFREAGFESGLNFSLDSDQPKERSLNAVDTALSCFSKMYEIHVDDSLILEPAFRFHRHPNFDEYGVVTFIDVDYLKRGEHLVAVKKWDHKKIKDKDTLVIEPFFQIPFWKE